MSFWKRTTTCRTSGTTGSRSKRPRQRQRQRESGVQNMHSAFCKQACKPGSVLTAIYLGLPLLAGSSHLPGTAGPAICPSTVLLRIEFTGPSSSQSAGELLPRLSTLTVQRERKLPEAAVSLCCTCPEVAFGGRYPLSLPYGARTFLTGDAFAFPCAAVQPACRGYFTRFH